MNDPQLFADGESMRIEFEPFTALLTFLPNSELTVEILEGLNAGFADLVDYETEVVRDGLVVLSFREHIGSTIVLVLDLDSHFAYAVVTPAIGGLMRLSGPIRRTMFAQRATYRGS